MARVDIKLNSRGIAEILKSQGVRDVVESAAASVHTNVQAALPGADVVMDSYTTDRAAASVTIREPLGRLFEARDGVLTGAAAAAGLEVTDR